MNKPDEKEFFEMRMESLSFAKEGIETNVNTGILTPSGYVQQITKYMTRVQKQAAEAAQTLGSQNEHTKRLNKRISLIKAEIVEM